MQTELMVDCEGGEKTDWSYLVLDMKAGQGNEDKFKFLAYRFGLKEKKFKLQIVELGILSEVGREG